MFSLNNCVFIDSVNLLSKTQTFILCAYVHCNFPKKARNNLNNQKSASATIRLNVSVSAETDLWSCCVMIVGKCWELVALSFRMFLFLTFCQRVFKRPAIFFFCRMWTMNLQSVGHPIIANLYTLLLKHPSCSWIAQTKILPLISSATLLWEVRLYIA